MFVRMIWKGACASNAPFFIRIDYLNDFSYVKCSYIN